MANNVTPLSFQSILGQMVSTVLSDLGLQKLKVGDPLLTILEAAAQSDFRQSQDNFNNLQSISLDSATGAALDNIGAAEDVPRPGATIATGVVTFSDTSITKISSTVYAGTPAPPSNSSSINIALGTVFPASGSIYIGRGTINLEGPLAYTSVTNNTNYYTINLSVTTKYFHNIGESVVLAQNGIRTIPSGTTIAIPQGTSLQNINYNTLYNSVIPDGETFVTGVQVVCQQAGTVGNAPANTITSITSSLYPSAAVTNSLPFSNAQDIMNDSDYRELIREARQTRTQGTDLAIENSVLGITSTSENKTVISSTLTSEGTFDLLTIDDGTGYEESDQGIALETILSPAVGGEYLFKLASQPPITKAQITSTISSPYNMTGLTLLTCNVGGIVTSHSFSTTDFASVSNATAYEIVASINADPNCLFAARTASAGTRSNYICKGRYK
ncbi:MAG: baseplate J/gp47 family protein [Elusimicrobia bacterium]|nr:baseplate J/gp47 family protein [Elusimicrobiota bacterium]